MAATSDSIVGVCAHCCSTLWGYITGKNEYFFIRCDLIMVKYRVQNIKNSELLKLLLHIYYRSNLSVKGPIDPSLPLTAFFLRLGRKLSLVLIAAHHNPPLSYCT